VKNQKKTKKKEKKNITSLKIKKKERKKNGDYPLNLLSGS